MSTPDHPRPDDLQITRDSGGTVEAFWSARGGVSLWVIPDRLRQTIDLDADACRQLAEWFTSAAAALEVLEARDEEERLAAWQTDEDGTVFVKGRTPEEDE